MTIVPEFSERLVAPISTSELERRWAAIRAAMERQGIDVLLVQGADDYHGGTVKYLTDLPAIGGSPMTVLFPRDDDMTLLRHGPPADTMVGPQGDGVLRGVRRVLTSACWPSVGYSLVPDVELTLKLLAPYGKARIGLVGVFSAPATTAGRLWTALAGYDVTDASDLVDRIKAVKSPEEQELIRRTAALQDLAMEAAFAVIEPGKTDGEIAAEAQYVAQLHGCEQGFFMCQSARPGEALYPAPRHFQNRVLREGDVLQLLLETNGPGGFYTHNGRFAVLGEAPQGMLEEFEFVLQAQDYTIELIKPGADPAEIWDAYNAFLREHGRPEETRLHCHGQGYDCVERPLIRFDETLPIQGAFNVGCHPMWHSPDGFINWVNDNWLIHEDGRNERLHSFRREIVQLDF